MKIGLMGCEFSSPNKGCEALSYSIISMLNKMEIIEDNSTIYNFSGTELGYIPKEFPRFEYINIKPNLKDITFKYLIALKKCDIIFDATMGDSFSDIYSEKYYNHLIRRKMLAELLCKKYVLLPQTYGPFKTEKSSRLANIVLRKATKIYCRDEISKRLLEENYNIKNVELSTDMAFILPYKKNKKKSNKEKVKIGINISGLLYKGGFHSKNQFGLSINYKKYIETLIEYLLSKKEYEIHLIPHVIDLNENAYDDDYKITEEIQKKYDNCVLPPPFKTPIEAKSYISNMDIFIGSRMHSTIASFSSGVVTIPISYSRKFEGLYDSLDYPYVINATKTNEEIAIEKVKEYIDKKDELLSVQKKANIIIQEKLEQLTISISKILNEVNENE